MMLTCVLGKEGKRNAQERNFCWGSNGSQHWPLVEGGKGILAVVNIILLFVFDLIVSLSHNNVVCC